MAGAESLGVRHLSMGRVLCRVTADESIEAEPEVDLDAEEEEQWAAQNPSQSAGKQACGLRKGSPYARIAQVARYGLFVPAGTPCR